MKYLNLLIVLALNLSLRVIAAQPGYTAHEWGTFTSVINKDGKQLEGLHHEEEALPRFVHDLSRRDGTLIRNPFPGGPITKGFTPQAMNLMPIPTFTERITQKMETPVIYFYANKEMEVNVKVDFPKGVISQWYPDVTKVNPSIEARNGHASWDVTILNETRGQLPTTSTNSIWNPSREVRSNIIKAKNQREKLIFYRGLGDFKTSLSIKYDEQTLTLENTTDQNIQGLILLNERSDTHEYLNIKELAAHSKKVISLKDSNSSIVKFSNHTQFIESAKKTILKHLIASGLYRDESIAMLETWQKGYFKTKGLRLLYILPSEWTQEILPLQFEPRPKEVVRTLVGRVEILTEQDDLEIVNFVKKYFSNDLQLLPVISGREMLGLGHFPEPKLRRALQLEFDSTIKNRIKSLIKKMNQNQIY